MNASTCATAHRVPPQPLEGHIVRRRANPLAVRRNLPSQKRRAHRCALYGGYSTISLGYAGSVSACWHDGQTSHGPQRNAVCAHAVMKYMNAACEKWKAETTIGFGLYGTPLESTTYKFAKCLQRRFGIIRASRISRISQTATTSTLPSILMRLKSSASSRSSRRFPPAVPSAVSRSRTCRITSKLSCRSSAISTITSWYAELNTKSDYCQKCGYDGEIQIVEDDGKLVWECPNCGNRDQDTMNVARRTLRVISAPSSGTRAVPPKSKSACCTCN